jgi:ribulose-5-phosphate 4-epimerase/fuculose-1-phosphate aldolase
MYEIDGVELAPKQLLPLSPPVFSDVKQERIHRKERLVGALRIFGALGFGEGVAGHITARDPEYTDHFWVNPFAMSFKKVRISDLLLINHIGEVVVGERAVNRAAFVLHAAIHQRRPEVIAAAHAHSPYGKAFSSLGKQLNPITQDACTFYKDHKLISIDGGRVVLEEESANCFADSFLAGKAAIHQNHGLFTVGETIDSAAFWFIAMERCCQAQLLAEAAGTPKLIQDEWAAYTSEQIGNELAGWYGFQSFWEEIITTDANMFD